MTLAEAKGSKWAMNRVLSYIQQVERAYDVSIKFWIQVKPDGRGGGYAAVHTTCSGDILDLVPPNFRLPESIVRDDEPHAVGEALYYSVLLWENYFHRVREPIGARPSL